MMLTIFTPVYNRAALLARAYGSLRAQTDSDFEWLVIDDGSTDGTPGALARIAAAHPAGSFPVRTVRTQGRGKHAAVNRAVEMAQGRWFMILDSDDWLEADAVATVRRRLGGVDPSGAGGLAGMVGLRVHPDGSVVGTPVRFDSRDLTYRDYRLRMGIEGDRAEVVATAVMRRYRFPVFEGERFLREGPLWQRIFTDYAMRYTSDRFYVCDYQPDGLTARIGALHDANPRGACWANVSALRFGGLGLWRSLKYVAQWMRWRSLMADPALAEPLPRRFRWMMAPAAALNALRRVVRRS